MQQLRDWASDDLWGVASVSAELRSVRTQVDVYKKWVTDHFTPLLCINLWGLAVFVLVFLLTQTSAHYEFPSFISFFHSFLLFCLSLVEFFLLGWMKSCHFFFSEPKLILAPAMNPKLLFLSLFFIYWVFCIIIIDVDTDVVCGVQMHTHGQTHR